MENLMLIDAHWEHMERGKIPATFKECTICGELYDEDEMIYTRDGEWVCEECADGIYYYCEACMDWVHADEWNEHVGLCEECSKEEEK